MDQVGIIGLGRMGSALAQRMASEGQSVRGWTRSGRQIDGVAQAPTLASMVSGSHTLVLSLYDDRAVAETLDALLGCDLSGRSIIETSTITPAVLTDRAARIEAAGASIVDAPISGGPELVRAGQCGIFLGGDKAAADHAQRVMGTVSQRIFHVGPLGTGLVMKVINNGMLQAYTAGLADMMPLAKKAGLPLDTALRILCGGPAGIPLIRDRLPKILGEDDSVGFPVSGVMKDCEVFRHVLESYGLTSKVLDRFAALEPEARAAGIMDSDVAMLVRAAYTSGEER